MIGANGAVAPIVPSRIFESHEVQEPFCYDLKYCNNNDCNGSCGEIDGEKSWSRIRRLFPVNGRDDRMEIPPEVPPEVPIIFIALLMLSGWGVTRVTLSWLFIYLFIYFL